MIALNSTRSLEIILAGAVTTNQLPFTATYVDHTPNTPPVIPVTTSTPADGQTNNAVAVTMVPAPAVGTQRTIKRINVYNADTAQATVTIRVNNGGTLRNQLSVILSAGERIEYEDSKGFSIYDTFGAQKVTAVQNVVEPGYIDGLRMVWDATNGFSVTSGTCYIPSVGRNVNFPSTISKAGLVLANNTWYHVYGFLNSGVPDVEHSTTAPVIYNGVARNKSGDTTRRYIGSFRTSSGGAIFKFKQAGNLITYLENIAVSPFLVLAGGTATVYTSVDVSAVIPVTSQQISLVMLNFGTASAFLIISTTDGPAHPGYIALASPGGVTTTITVTNASQALLYAYDVAPAGNSAFIRVAAYAYER